MNLHLRFQSDQLERDDDIEWGTVNLSTRFFTEASLIDQDSIALDNTQITVEDLSDSSNDWVGAGLKGESDYASLILEFKDTGILSDFAKVNIYWINITDRETGEDKAFYNFTHSLKTKERSSTLPTLCSDSFFGQALVPSDAPDCEYGKIEVGSFNITSENFEVIGTPITSDFEDSTIPLQGVSTYKVRGNSTNGFGLNSTEVDFGLIQPITNLNATALNSTAIKLIWDQATTEHPSDPLTGVIIQRLGPEESVYACSSCGSTGVEVGPLPNKVYGQRITLNQTETIDKIVNQQRWFNGPVTGGTIDVFIAHTNGTVIQLVMQ